MNLVIRLTAVAAFAFMGQKAFAADMPLKPATSYLEPALVRSWTGFYVGAVAGVNPLEDGRVFFDGGVEGGYNYQINNFVLGFETDVTARPLDQKQTWFSTNSFGTPFINNRTSTSTLINTARGRLGYAFGNFLPYVTGGLAYGDFRLTQTDAIPVGPFAGEVWHGDHSWLRAGFAAGGGLEYALTDAISLKGEYLFYEFEGVTLIDTLNVNPARTERGPSDHGRGHIARLGINYKFN